MRSILNFARSIYHQTKYWLSNTFDDGVAVIVNILSTEAKDGRLLILDDIFPHMLSAFRIAEYNSYLQEFQNAEVLSTATAFRLIGETKSFDDVLKEYEINFPEYSGKTQRYRRFRGLHSGLVYTIFSDNAFKFINDAERYKSPFVFTLYPGGGFGISEKCSDQHLQRIFNSPSFRKVITTQKISYEYLASRGLCPPEQIEFIYGGVLPPKLLSQNTNRKIRLGDGKDTLDICFVANKYTKSGIDKGYDIFIDVAKQLSKARDGLVFHVVGPYDRNDIEMSEIEDHVRFHGWIYTDVFPKFYANMDIILSPNRPFILSKGSFDGFPTGSCVEAGLCGVAVFCTDPLQQNTVFHNGEDIVIVKHSVDEICEQVLNYYQEPEKLYLLAERGQKAFQEIFALEKQIKPRIRILSSILTNS